MSLCHFQGKDILISALRKGWSMTLKLSQFIVLVSGLLALPTFAGLTKRDTLDDISNSIGDMLGINNKDIVEQIEDLEYDKTKYCIQDSGCFQPIQYCEKSTYKLYGTCTFVVWFWICVVTFLLVFFFSCLTSLLCCFCNCCRKAASWINYKTHQTPRFMCTSFINRP